MSNAKNLLDRWMSARKIETLTAAAKALGKSGSGTLSNWRSGYSKPDDASIALMCDEIGENDQLWIGRINAEFEKDVRLRKFWEKVAKTAAVVFISFGLLNVQTASAESVSSISQNPATLYIM